MCVGVGGVCVILHLASQLLPDQHNHADVGRDVDQVGHQTLIETAHALVPPSLFDAVPGAAVAMMMVLQAGSYYLVWVGGSSGDQLGDGRKGEVLGGGLRDGERKNMYISMEFIEWLPNLKQRRHHRRIYTRFPRQMWSSIYKHRISRNYLLIILRTIYKFSSLILSNFILFMLYF